MHTVRAQAVKYIVCLVVLDLFNGMVHSADLLHVALTQYIVEKQKLGGAASFARSLS